MRVFAWLVAVAAALTLWPPAATHAQAPQRVALVVGNAAYKTAGWELVNPVRDARLIARRLQALGFSVTTLENATKPQLEAAMNGFAQKIRIGGPEAVGVFYYAGHGVEHDGANLLIPVDVSARTMDELRFQAPPMQFLLRDMARAGNAVNIVILDACRNLPLPSGTRDGPAGGLADLDDIPDNVLIAYATRPGLTAPDNPRDTNSVFTRTLATALERDAGAQIESLFATVQASVYRDTQGGQRPEFRATFTAMSGSGCRTATWARTPARLRTVRRSQPGIARLASSGAVLGTTIRSTSARRSAAGALPRTGTTLSVSVSPGPFHLLVLNEPHLLRL